ncbi:MAG: hypothetical protein Q8914_05505 [Bacteroidota bacterium]|nr:hypothetical protein [Bacteroidota bacterium]
MKKSTLIIIAFSVFILIGMLTLFIYSETHESSGSPAKQKEVTELPHFSVIVAEQGSRLLAIRSGKANRLIRLYSKNERAEKAAYCIKNDTLYLKGKYDPDEYQRNLIIECTSICTLLDDGNNINLSNLKADSLTIRSNSGYIILGSQYENRTGSLACAIGQLTFEGERNAHLSLSNTRIDRLQIRLNESNATLHNGNFIKQTKAVLRDHSQFNQWDDELNQLEFTADRTCQYSLKKDKN